MWGNQQQPRKQGGKMGGVPGPKLGGFGLESAGKGAHKKAEKKKDAKYEPRGRGEWISDGLKACSGQKRKNQRIVG